MKLLTNANIHTMNPDSPKAEALLIDQGRIIAAGKTDHLQARSNVETVTQDMAGQTLIPGLTDSHVHLHHYALSLQKIDCETRSLEECLQRVKNKVKTTPAGTWILGHGWQHNDWLDCGHGLEGFPSALMLDEISSEHPIYLTAKSLHAGWANTAALKAAGLHKDSPDPHDGALQRDESGALTGILLEGAMGLVSSFVPKPNEKQLADAIQVAQQKLWSLGLTGVHDFDRRACFVALQILREERRLNLRIVKNIPVEDLEIAIELGLRSGFGDEMLRIGNIKAFADGALGPHTAAMIQPYDDDPDNTGMLLLDSEEIFEYGQKAVRNGFGLTTHAIGDKANHEVLKAYANLRKLEAREKLPSHRHRIEHVQLLHPDDLTMLADLDIIASMQPIHATSDMFAADRFWGDRAKYAYAWRSLLDAGTIMAYGSDAPVESPNPFWGLHAAITRTRPGNIPSAEGWYPKQKLTRMEAFEGFTTGAAYTAGTEHSTGMLAPGYLADLIVLDQDPFTCDVSLIRDLLPERTMVGGEWVFTA